jgi:nucleoside-diphosphate-sugar epimerase
MRPNLHIQDYCDVIKLFLNADSDQVRNQIFNVGYQNLTISEISLMVKKIVEKEFPGNEIEIEKTPTDDNRSYHINSDKITKVLGFRPKHTIEDAILELCSAFREGKLPQSLTDDRYFNVKRIKRIQAK